MSDMARKGRAVAGITLGEANPNSKLTNADVLQIRASYRSGATSYRKLAKKFTVDPMTICHVVNQKIWKHVL